MPNPIVSIVIPVRNAESTLHECIDSIRSQTLTDFEVIAIDDGSDDRSADILAQWAGQDQRVVRLKQARLGIVTALNCGMQAANGKYIARMDADDIMYPSRLQKQIYFLQHNKHIDLVACQVRLFPHHTIKAGYGEYIRWQNQCLTEQDIRDEIYIESPFAHPSVIFKKQVVMDLGGYHQGDFPEDYELWLRMAHAGCRMAKLPECLLDWRESTGRASRIDSRYLRPAFDRVRCRYLSQDKRIAGKRPVVYWGAGRKTRKRSGLLVNKGFTPSAWIDIDDKKIGNFIAGVKVQAPTWLDSPSKKPFVLSYVTNHGARALISEQLASYGYKRGADFLHVG